MANRGFGLALLIFRGRDSRGLVKACCQGDLFLACRHTKTAWIKAWAEVSDFLLRQQGHDNDDQIPALGVAGVSSRVAARIIPLPTGSFPSAGTSRRDAGRRRCCPPG